MTNMWPDNTCPSSISIYTDTVRSQCRRLCSTVRWLSSKCYHSTNGRLVV